MDKFLCENCDELCEGDVVPIDGEDWCERCDRLARQRQRELAANDWWLPADRKAS